MKKKVSRVGLIVLLTMFVVSSAACAQTAQERERLSVEHSERGDRLRRAGDLQGALAEHQKAAELAPDDAKSYTALAYIYMELKEFEQAKIELEKAVALDPKDTTARSMLASVLEELGDQQGSMKQYQEAVNIAPRDPYFITNLGIAQEHSGDNDLARKTYKQALSIDSGYSYALYRLGELENEEGRRALTIELFKRAAERKPPPEREEQERPFITESKKIDAANRAELENNIPSKHKSRIRI